MITRYENQSAADAGYKDKIRAFYASKRRMPSYEEARKLLGFASKNAVARLVERLEREGFLGREGGKLVPLQIWGEVKLLGLVEAGFPTQAEEDVLDTMSLDEFLIANKEASYLLRVKGDSMKDAGIFEGDMVLVERTEAAKLGEIVIAAVDGKYTMKYLKSSPKGIYFLEPANRKYPPIFPKEDLKVEAVVKAVIRKY